MLILAKTRPRKSSGYIVAILALASYACTPTVSLRRLENVEKIPVRAVLLLEPSFESREFRGGGSVRITTYVGRASRTLFETGLGVLFEKVDVVTPGILIPSNVLIFIPEIRHLNAYRAEGSAAIATVEYALTVKTSAGQIIFANKAMATERDELGPLSTLARLLFHTATLTVGAEADLNERFSSLFALAMESAFEQLMRDLQSADSFSRYVKTETERRTLPAELITEVSFADRQGLLPNNSLDAGEEGELVATVQNRGRGAAFAVEIFISAESPGIRISGRHPVGDIPPGENRSIKVPILGGLDIRSGVADILIEAKEKRGYDAQKVKLVVPTARLERPSLLITSYEINDGTTGLARGNGNGIPESGETIELLTFVRNSGPGPAAATTLSLVSVDRGVEVVQRDVSLGTILPNQTARGNLAFTIPRTYIGTNLNLTLQARDGRGEAVATASREISLPLTARAPVLAATPRILIGGREIKELTNGQTVEVEVTPRNTGTLDAEQVMVRLSARESGVVFRQDREVIGSLRAGTAGRPVVFELNIPRTFVNDRLALNVELSQREFSSQTERLDIPVVVRRPVLASSFTVAGRLGGRGIEQNETADLEVRVVNTGNLAAEGVTVGIDVKVPGVEVQGSKRVDIGTIPRSGQGFARFKLQLRRSVPPGELLISLTVSQAEFSSLSETLRLTVQPEKAMEVPVAGAPAPPPVPSRVPPPVIALANPSDGQFVQGEQIEIRGTVVDEKGVDRIRISVNGKTVPDETVQKGLRRQPGASRDQVDLRVPVSLQHGRNSIEITAYNIANEQERLTRTVTRLEDQPTKRDISPALVARADVDRYILNLTPASSDRRKWAVIVGIEQYRRAPSVVFAARDAIAMREYAVKLLGVPAEQVFYLADDQATKSEIQVILEDRLQHRVQSGDTVYVYYAGHGVPEIRDGTPYILPADGDPESLRFSGYSMKEFYAALGKLKADRVLVFLDACFSGLSARQVPTEMLLAGTRPIGWVVDDPVLLSPNLISFAAAEKNQVSSAYKEQAHGLFTYYLLKGLSGAADKNADGNIAVSELAAYVRDEVSRTSRQLFGQNLHQTPVIRPSIDASRDIVLKAK